MQVTKYLRIEKFIFACRIPINWFTISATKQHFKFKCRVRVGCNDDGERKRKLRVAKTSVDFHICTSMLINWLVFQCPTTIGTYNRRYRTFRRSSKLKSKSIKNVFFFCSGLYASRGKSKRMKGDAWSVIVDDESCPSRQQQQQQLTRIQLQLRSGRRHFAATSKEADFSCSANDKMLDIKIDTNAYIIADAISLHRIPAYLFICLSVSVRMRRMFLLAAAPTLCDVQQMDRDTQREKEREKEAAKIHSMTYDSGKHSSR